MGTLQTVSLCQDCAALLVLLSPSLSLLLAHGSREDDTRSARLKCRIGRTTESTLRYSTNTCLFKSYDHSSIYSSLWLDTTDLYRHGGLPRGARPLTTLAYSEVLACFLSAGLGATGVFLSPLIGPLTWADMT
jgi:hypothetical protein